MVDAAGRAETAQQLRAEAHQLLAESGLFALLQERFGDPSVTGSAGYDLMVWRHIDIHMPLEVERLEEWLGFITEIAAQLASAGLELTEARFGNHYAEPGPLGSGLFWGIGFRDSAGNPWKIDLWGWDPFDYAVRQARDFSLRTDLAACNRDLILKLKTEARQRTRYYGERIGAHDIYQFVIAGAGDSLETLERWKGLR